MATEQVRMWRPADEERALVIAGRTDRYAGDVGNSDGVSLSARNAGIESAVGELPHTELAAHAEQYRRVNDGIHRSGDGGFLCECLRADCNEVVELDADEYEGVRADRRRFFVLPGHELAAIDAVVERHERYLVVDRASKGFPVRDARPASPV
jgi:hypothetical protein